MYTHSQTHSHTHDHLACCSCSASLAFFASSCAFKLFIELLDEYLFGVLSPVQRDDGVRKVGRLDAPDVVFGYLLFLFFEWMVDAAHVFLLTHGTQHLGGVRHEEVGRLQGPDVMT